VVSPVLRVVEVRAVQQRVRRCLANAVFDRPVARGTSIRRPARRRPKEGSVELAAQVFVRNGLARPNPPAKFHLTDGPLAVWRVIAYVAVIVLLRSDSGSSRSWRRDLGRSPSSWRIGNGTDRQGAPSSVTLARALDRLRSADGSGVRCARCGNSERSSCRFAVKTDRVALLAGDPTATDGLDRVSPPGCHALATPSSTTSDRTVGDGAGDRARVRGCHRQPSSGSGLSCLPSRSMSCCRSMTTGVKVPPPPVPRASNRRSP